MGCRSRCQLTHQPSPATTHHHDANNPTTHITITHGHPRPHPPHTVHYHAMHMYMRQLDRGPHPPHTHTHALIPSPQPLNLGLLLDNHLATRAQLVHKRADSRADLVLSAVVSSALPQSPNTSPTPTFRFLPIRNTSSCRFAISRRTSSYASHVGSALRSSGGVEPLLDRGVLLSSSIGSTSEGRNLAELGWRVATGPEVGVAMDTARVVGRGGTAARTGALTVRSPLFSSAPRSFLSSNPRLTGDEGTLVALLSAKTLRANEGVDRARRGWGVSGAHNSNLQLRQGVSWPRQAQDAPTPPPSGAKTGPPDQR